MGSLCESNKEYGISIFWRVENFISRPNSFLQSSVFEIKILESNWQLGISQTINGYLSAYLYRVTNRISTFLDVTVSLLTGSGWNTILEETEFGFKADGEGCGVDQLVSLENLKSKKWFYLPNGSLTINFQLWNGKIGGSCSQYLLVSRLVNARDLYHRPVEIFQNLKQIDLITFPASYKFKLYETSKDVSCTKAKELKYDIPTSHEFESTETSKFLSYKEAGEDKNIKAKDFETEFAQTDKKESEGVILKFIKEKKLSFVTLQTKCKTFYVPKVVLCASSTVFRDLIETKMAKSSKSSIQIEEISDETLTSLIDYLHFGQFDELSWEATVNLYKASHMYQICSLKTECISLLKKKLFIKNICDAFILADSHKDKDLMRNAMEFFCQNSKAVLATEEWNEILLNHKKLFTEIMSELAENFLKYVSDGN